MRVPVRQEETSGLKDMEEKMERGYMVIVREDRQRKTLLIAILLLFNDKLR